MGMDAGVGSDMALLVGKHVNKIDRKGRVSVPKPFRAFFEGPDFSGIYAYPSFKFPAIEVCAEAFMTRLGESLDDLDMFSDDQDDLASVVLENAHPLPFDPEGRVVLPQELIDTAGLSGMALFVGRANRVQIWKPETYDELRGPAFERARARGATLRLRPRTPEDPA